MGFPGEIGTDSSGQSRIESGRSGTGLRSHTTKALKMDSEKTLAADAVATEKPTQADNARRTSRRQEIRAALLAVPAVLTLTSNASAQTGQYGYGSGGTMMMMM